MGTVITKLEFIEDKLDICASFTAAVTFACMSIIVCTQVISRYFFNYSFQWSEEMGRYFFIWSTMLASACATHTHLHIGVDILVSSLKGRTQLAVKLLAQLSLLAAVCIMTTYGTSQTLDVYSSGQTATSFPVSAALLYLSVPVSGALMMYYCFVQLLELLFYGKFRDTKIHDFFKPREEARA